MKIGFWSLAACCCLMSNGTTAQIGTVQLGEDAARAVVGRDAPAHDARIGKARAWLKKIAAASGESEQQAAASAIKASAFMQQSLNVRALPIEVLEGMAAQAAPGKPLGDMTGGYFQARRDATDKSHQAALAALTAKK